MTKLTLADGSQYDLTVAGFSYADSDKKTVCLELLTNIDLDAIITDFNDASKTSQMSVTLDRDIEGPVYSGFTELANDYNVKKNVQGYENKISLKLSKTETIIDNE